MILSVSNIHKSFNEVPVLRNVSFHIEDNEKAAIVGINGAGKTTLLRIIMGELSADEGLVTLQRIKPSGISPSMKLCPGKTPSIRNSSPSSRRFWIWSSRCIR